MTPEVTGTLVRSEEPAPYESRAAQRSKQLHDVQGEADARGIAIAQVGVSDLRYPITVLDRANRTQATIATISLSVGLPAEQKGTHMSRFIEVLEAHGGELTHRTIPDLLRALQARLETRSARIEVEFPYFIKRRAPASGAEAPIDYNCLFAGQVDGPDLDFELGVEVPVTSLCPCSKAISDYGAHNQRGIIGIRVASEHMIWIEDLVEMAESCASAPVFSLLKREDERHVTMQAYENPAFVEDMARDVAIRLQRDPRVRRFHLHVVNAESIHNHNAFASLSWQR